MKKYELVYIVHPDLETTIDKVTEKVAGFVLRRDGKVLKEDNWGKKKLAYKILKQDFGIYVVLDFEIDPKNVILVERDIRLSEDIIRHLLTIKEEITEAPQRKIPEAKPEKVKTEKEVKEPKTKAEEKVDSKTEEERLKKLDEKLDELIGGTTE